MEDNKNLSHTSPNISATTFSLDFFFFSFFSFFSVFFLKYIIHVSLSSTKISERDQLASEKHQQTLRDLTIMPGQKEIQCTAPYYVLNVVLSESYPQFCVNRIWLQMSCCHENRSKLILRNSRVKKGQ